MYTNLSRISYQSTRKITFKFLLLPYIRFWNPFALWFSFVFFHQTPREKHMYPRICLYKKILYEERGVHQKRKEKKDDKQKKNDGQGLTE